MLDSCHCKFKDDNKDNILNFKILIRKMIPMIPIKTKSQSCILRVSPFIPSLIPFSEAILSLLSITLIQYLQSLA